MWLIKLFEQFISEEVSPLARPGSVPANIPAVAGPKGPAVSDAPGSVAANIPAVAGPKGPAVSDAPVEPAEPADTDYKTRYVGKTVNLYDDEANTQFFKTFTITDIEAFRNTGRYELVVIITLDKDVYGCTRFGFMCDRRGFVPLDALDPNWGTLDRNDDIFNKMVRFFKDDEDRFYSIPLTKQLKDEFCVKNSAGALVPKADFAATSIPNSQNNKNIS